MAGRRDLREASKKGGAVALVSIGSNSLFIAYLIDASGGSVSTIWPLFLLPIYTAGFVLPNWVLRTAGLNIALLSCFYLDSWVSGGDVVLLQLAFKLAFLALSSFLIARMALKERLTELISLRRRRNVAFLRRRVQESRERAVLTGDAVDAALQGLGDRIQAILATAQLLLEDSGLSREARQDAERIARCAAECGDFTKGLRVRTQDIAPPVAGGRV